MKNVQNVAKNYTTAVEWIKLINTSDWKKLKKTPDNIIFEMGS